MSARTKPNEDSSPEPALVVVITRDLMDGSRFRAVDSTRVAVVRDLRADEVGSADLLVLDLASDVDAADAVATGIPVIAYGAHVDVDALAAARAAGCRDAVPRSQIFRRFGEVIAGDR